MIELANAGEHGAWHSVSYLPPVDRDDWHLSAESAGDKRLVRTIHIIEREILFQNRNIVFATEFDDFASRNTVHAVVTRRRPDFALANNKKIGRIAGADKAVRVQHQAFIRTRLASLNHGDNAVQLAMRIEPWILYIRRPPVNMYGEKANPFFNRSLAWFLMFSDDDNGGTVNA